MAVADCNGTLLRLDRNLITGRNGTVTGLGKGLQIYADFTHHTEQNPHKSVQPAAHFYRNFNCKAEEKEVLYFFLSFSFFSFFDFAVK
jgi:hypothetical protein